MIRLLVPASIGSLSLLLSTLDCFADEQKSSDHVYTEPPISASDRDHWSLKPRTPVEIPETSTEHWQRNPVDAFITAALESRGLTPQPEADHRTLVRRVSLELTGLPPTPNEVAAFIADESPMAFESLIDRLLASPAYGERRAQHWLDLARFAETDGYEHDSIRANAWRYRDWVIFESSISLKKNVSVTGLKERFPYTQASHVMIRGDYRQPGVEITPDVLRVLESDSLRYAVSPQQNSAIRS